MLGVLSILTVFAALFLVYGMQRFWRELDDSPKRSKRFWFWAMALGVNVGAMFYYFCVYSKVNPSDTIAAQD